MHRLKILSVVLVAIMGCFAFFSVEQNRNRKEFESGTSPLPAEALASLCTKLSLDPSQAICSGENDVYAPEVIDILREQFRPTDDFKNDTTGAATFQEVERVIGEFRTECQPIVHQTNPEFYYYRCFYDLRGDNYWRSAFYFSYPDRILFSIRSGLLDSKD